MVADLVGDCYKDCYIDCKDCIVVVEAACMDYERHKGYGKLAGMGYYIVVVNKADCMADCKAGCKAVVEVGMTC